MASSQQGLTGGSNDNARGNGCKSEKTRRSWSTKEEKVLLASLKELVVLGWKADNGFRVGYLTKLEESMRKEFPDTDLKGMPHINSKLGAWKRNYYSLCLMLNNSGVGFNSKGTFMIDCTNETWEHKKDNNDLRMRFKSWPLFKDWKEIFRKDRANGMQVEDVMEAMHEMYQADNVHEGGVDVSNHAPVTEEVANNDVEDSVCQSDRSGPTPKVSNKKRKARNKMDGVCAVLCEISRNADSRLGELITHVGYDFDLGKARQTVFEKLGTIPGLSMTDKFNLCEILADKVERLEIFIGLSEEAKAGYVEHLLQTKKD